MTDGGFPEDEVPDTREAEDGGEARPDVQEQIDAIKEQLEEGVDPEDIELPGGSDYDEQEILENLPTSNEEKLRERIDEEVFKQAIEEYSDPENIDNVLDLENALEEGMEVVREERLTEPPLTVEEAQDQYADPEFDMDEEDLEAKLDFANATHDPYEEVENPREEPFAVRLGESSAGGRVADRFDVEINMNKGEKMQLVIPSDVDNPDINIQRMSHGQLEIIGDVGSVTRGNIANTDVRVVGDMRGRELEATEGSITITGDAAVSREAIVRDELNVGGELECQLLSTERSMDGTIRARSLTGYDNEFAGEQSEVNLRETGQLFVEEEISDTDVIVGFNSTVEAGAMRDVGKIEANGEIDTDEEIEASRLIGEGIVTTGEGIHLGRFKPSIMEVDCGGDFNVLNARDRVTVGRNSRLSVDGDIRVTGRSRTHLVAEDGGVIRTAGDVEAEGNVGLRGGITQNPTVDVDGSIKANGVSAEGGELSADNLDLDERIEVGWNDEFSGRSTDVDVGTVTVDSVAVGQNGTDDISVSAEQINARGVESRSGTITTESLTVEDGVVEVENSSEVSAESIGLSGSVMYQRDYSNVEVGEAQMDESVIVANSHLDIGKVSGGIVTVHTATSKGPVEYAIGDVNNGSVRITSEDGAGNGEDTSVRVGNVTNGTIEAEDSVNLRFSGIENGKVEKPSGATVVDTGTWSGGPYGFAAYSTDGNSVNTDDVDFDIVDIETDDD